MSLLTCLLMVGVVLGVESRFTPEHLGTFTSACIVALALEVGVQMVAAYVASVDVSCLDVLAHSSYKCLHLCYLVALGGLAHIYYIYYVALIWASLASLFFLVYTTHHSITPLVTTHHSSILHTSP